MTTKPLVMHWDGSAWKVVPGPPVAAGSFGDVKIGPGGAPWVAGWARADDESEPGVVYRYEDGSWVALTAGLEDSIRANTLTVLSKNDAWAALNAGMAHFDGDSWKLVPEVPTDGSQIATGMVAAGPNDIWAVGVHHTGGLDGERPLVLHFDGTSWKRTPAPDSWTQLSDVALHNGRPIAVGERLSEDGDIIRSKPAVLEYRRSEFVEAESPTDAYGSLSSAATSQGRLWTAGITYGNLEEGFAAFAAYAE